MPTLIPAPDFVTFARANCAQPDSNPEHWHSDDPKELATAINTCHDCPLKAPCATYATTHNLTGIWGGLTRAQRNGTTDDTTVHPHDDDWIDDTGRTRRACGTHGAYQQHRRRAERCDRCETAQAARVREGRLNLLADAHAIGGTEQGYYTHRRLNERPCDLCKGAMRRASAERKAQRDAEKNATRAIYEPAA
ncbi:WhiB family transcriptional regulator [Streptomyces sp. DSM 41524]|uniref:WhiB family transcriptional regulator n=1 Tax=Streptomyces asiaticus subsp. ignotus TaxID=3098222 RepID=A0ABU7QD29_9ACTN|nr:WhiB family transcriptional regulator [Streptomyces sp. DSM 41524]